MFYLLLGKIRKIPSKIQLPNDKKIKQVVIFFPIDENLFRLSLYSFRKFNLHKDNIRYHFVINQKFQNLIHLSGPELIFVNYKKNKIQFCDLEQKNNLIQNDNDIIIDLNIDFSFAPSKFIAYLKSNFKIGFKTKFSDYFYNLQLKINRKGTVENSYEEIQQILASL